MKPRIYHSTDHQIDEEQIDADAIFVLETLQKAGHTAYLVGGGVRDLLLGYIPKDYDISTSATPEEIKSLFRNCILIGRRFRLAHVRFGRKVIEVATFRMGDNEDDTLIAFDNEFGSEEEDVLRRDFTINGLFYNHSNQTVIDYVGGFEDARKRLLRCIGNPEIRFRQDPVRMIRLLKFRARFGLEVEEPTINAMLSNRSEILKSSPARILEELLRMLESGSSLSFIKLLAEYGYLEILLPNLAAALSKEEGTEILLFLGMHDEIIINKEPFYLTRPILISSILFPLYHKYIHILNDGRKKPLHMGNIQDAAYHIIKDTFNSHVQLPKRTFANVAFILSTQYRFTPLDSKKRISYRIPESEYFKDAFKFFKLRGLIEPGLAELLTEWDYYYKKHQKSEPQIQDNPHRAKRRRRPR